MKWFNVDGHFAKSKIIESEVSYQRKTNPTKIHKGIQRRCHQIGSGAWIQQFRYWEALGMHPPDISRWIREFRTEQEDIAKGGVTRRELGDEVRPQG
ncbi:MAG: hypothetical protein SWO11_14290, partial [Thermodesulfobacteriota bacterium]|nr:hypothetical protein [Thermodesulfobacteriota bacterium]